MQPAGKTSEAGKTFTQVAPLPNFVARLKYSDFNGIMLVDITAAGMSTEECLSRCADYFFGPVGNRLIADARCNHFGTVMHPAAAEPIAVIIDGEQYFAGFIRNSQNWSHTLSRAGVLLGQTGGNVFLEPWDARAPWREYANRAVSLPSVQPS